MDEKMSNPIDSNARRKQIWIVAIILLILLTLAFAIGFTLGGQNVKTPIIIEKNTP